MQITSLDLEKVHRENMRFIMDRYNACMEKLHNYKDQISQISIAMQKNNPKFYFEKLSEIDDMDKEELDEEKKTWNFKNPSFTKLDSDPYKFEEFRVFKSWMPAQVEMCEHKKRDIIVTFCKKAHCKTCLENLIGSGSKNCPCEVKLSPKNVHEVMGFGYRLDSFINN
jgi:hypothetical protein